MKPQKVKPAKFNKHGIVYEDDEFSIAFGHYDNAKEPTLAMRWNGYKEDIRYPSQGGNPLWFQLPNTGIWVPEILKAIANITNHKKQIAELKLRIK